MKIGTSSDSVTYTLSYSALTGLLTLTGSDGSTSTVTIESGSSDAITGITVNGTTVTVTDGVAAISIPTNVSAFTNDAGYITSYTETDPIFTASAVYGITSTDITNWNNKFNAGHGIYSGASLNDCTIAGWYYISPSITTANIPVTSWGILEVIRTSRNDAGAVLQRFTAVNNGITYTRYDANATGSFTGWHKMKNDVPDIVQFYISKSSYSRSGYSNLQITTRTNISGDTSFTSANTDYWNIQLNPGIYRMDLYCSFQSSSAVASDVGIGLGNNANRRATPIEARVQTTGSITKLNASGILKVTSYNDLYSFLIYMGDTTTRDIDGYWTIERIGQ